MNPTGFYLELPRQLDLAFAEHLYHDATNQLDSKEKNILVTLRQSLKLGNAEAGWVLVNFSRPDEADNVARQDKQDYFGYLMATALLNHHEASEELECLIQHINDQDLCQLERLLRHYHLLEYDISHWEQLIQARLGLLDAYSISHQSADLDADGVPPH